MILYERSFLCFVHFHGNFSLVGLKVDSETRQNSPKLAKTRLKFQKMRLKLKEVRLKLKSKLD
jgi:hypothetical protein